MTAMAEGEPVTELREATAVFRRIERRHDEARDRLAAAIRAASEAGMRQRDIVAITGYTREHVRRLLKND